MESERWQAARWQKLDAILDRAFASPANERDACLVEHCGDDAELLAEARALVAADEHLPPPEEASFLETLVSSASVLVEEPNRLDDDPIVQRGRFGKYTIAQLIGEGGFGRVYRGEDPVLGRQVAIKLCASRSERVRQRFLREAKIGAGLQHPNVVTIYDYGDQQGQPFLVQELLAGEDASRVVRRRESLSLESKIDILRQVATGLAHAHEHGVLHRDIKPANVRLLPDGQVKILDFGIARLADEQSGLTTEGVAMGTVGYLAPEQLDGGTVDRRSDVFAFGVLAYELLTYQRPFEGTTFSRVSYRLLYEQPTELAELEPACPTDLAKLIERCLQKRPENRYESMSPVLEQLEGLADGSAVHIESAANARWRLRTRSALLAMFLVITVAVFWWLGIGPADQGVRPPVQDSPSERASSNGDHALLDSEVSDPLPVIDEAGSVASPEPAPSAEMAAIEGPATEVESAPREETLAQPPVVTALSTTDGVEAMAGSVVASQAAADPRSQQTSSAETETRPVTPERAVDTDDLVEPRAPDSVAPDRAPVLIERVEPKYPPRAYRRDIEARVVLAVLVDETGRVVRTLVKSSTVDGHGFEDAAINAAKRSKFEPGSRDGGAAKVWTEMVFDYSL